MESRVLVLFLGLTLCIGGLTGCARDRLVQAEDTTQPPVIEPDVERRDIEVRSAEAIADMLTMAFDKYCAPETASA